MDGGQWIGHDDVQQERTLGRDRREQPVGPGPAERLDILVAAQAGGEQIEVAQLLIEVGALSGHDRQRLLAEIGLAFVERLARDQIIATNTGSISTRARAAPAAGVAVAREAVAQLPGIVDQPAERSIQGIT